MTQWIMGLAVGLLLVCSYGFIAYWFVRVLFRWLHEKDK